MYTNNEAIVLASGSPRRKEFLVELGLTFDVKAAAIDEEPRQFENAEDFVLRMAQEKAEAVAQQFPERWIISGDTIVCLHQSILGKPESVEHAVELLLRLSGQAHIVRSSFCIFQQKKKIFRTGSVQTLVRFSAFPEDVARAYVATGEPMDKAGAYGIQGIGGTLVESIEGSYSNVVGLPMAELVSVLVEEDVVRVKDAPNVLA